MNAATAKQTIQNLLQESMLLVPEQERLVFEAPADIDEYELTHPRGAIVFAYKGWTNSKPTGDVNCLRQLKEHTIGVLIYVRKLDSTYRTVENWLDWIEDALAGHEIETYRPDRKIYVATAQLLGEAMDVWHYGIEVIIPTDFVEPVYR